MNASSTLVIVPSVLLALAIIGFLFYSRHERQRGRLSIINNRRSDIERERVALERDLHFYEQKKIDLTRRALQRRQLVQAARSVGSCLDPADIQAKLIEATEALFPGKRAEISVGQNSDRTNPLVKVTPIKVQGDIVAGLRVVAHKEAPFSQDDIRILDVLGNFASLALENSSLFKQIQESALRDNLTGLWTHKAFQEHLEAALLDASRYGHSMSLILSDVDHFKNVNDTYGHQAGDSILQGFAHVMSRHVRDVDMVARYGGEEFVILLLQTSHAEARQAAEALRVDLEAQRFSTGKSTIGITGSFGVATFPQDATSAQQLIRIADERLYAAKKAGRNQVKGRAA